MRANYQDGLDSIADDLVTMTRLVGVAMTDATVALVDADRARAESVIDGDAEVDRVYRDVEQRAFELLARHQPVATDLRAVITSLRMVADLERSGDLALHVAKLARRRYPDSAVPAELADTFRRMGVVAADISAKAGVVIATRDTDVAAEVETDDDEMDHLHRTLFATMLGPEWTHGVESAIDVALLGRYYERFADHAVSVARRVVYLVTGAMPETA